VIEPGAPVQLVLEELTIWGLSLALIGLD